MFWNRERHRTIKGLAAGAVGGMIASFAMNQFQARVSKLFESPRQPAQKKKRARQAQGWKEHREPARRQNPEEVENATIKAAAAVSETVFHHKLKRKEREPAGNIMHYAYGIVTGAVYGMAVEEWDAARAGEGTAF